ncbi:hypothetical protein BCR33DRAFT_801747 [Rhizoclosmatium globosum]|uniref:Cytochrome b561 domain-containing protein n=1 Tax=Rhizoclosmatium globosum TaxID=329046 RepID=A0A1Y2D3S1_9FUNG|nr:hypothetical protein BCR33DRAFT_801747 [Rhizoclosmatium globosum]|eukprot:ORY53923.1 hypothetical protein BCR33DRAFT_801747 [Rhizoclosmatium globosum]
MDLVPSPLHLFTLAFLLNVVALVLIYMVTGSDHFDVAANGAHVGIGLFVWIAVFVQMALGVLINHLYKPDRESTPWWDHFHHWLGRILFVVSIVNIPLGINLYIAGLPDDMSVNPALQTIYIVWVVLVALRLFLWNSREEVPKWLHNVRKQFRLQRSSQVRYM